jgi:hypothetical protein
MPINITNEYTILNEKYPFLTIGTYSEQEYIGVVQNSSKTLISIYCLNDIKDDGLRALFLSLSEEYWWTSNRTVSISIFLKPDFDIFKPYLKHCVAKECTVLHGPVISMDNLVRKRQKKRKIELVRNLDDN